MNVLVACEESQRVCTAFRKLGHVAYSCDIQMASGSHPEWHVQTDVIALLNGKCNFFTTDGVLHFIDKWDLIIAHPPCTYLTLTGNRWFNEQKYGEKARLRKKKREDAIKFFMEFVNADCEKVAIENPVGIMSTKYRKPDQIIQPYLFGDAYEKRTALWLRGLPTLKPTKIVQPPPRIVYESGKSMPGWYVEAGRLQPEERTKIRSKTFEGIATAMAEQWGGGD